jgi:hypothetical protein
MIPNIMSQNNPEYFVEILLLLTDICIKFYKT